MVLLAALSALVIGLTLGLLGAGGSILTVPVLHYIVGLDAVESTSTSLIIVGVTALAAALLYAKQGLVHLGSGLAFAIPSILGMALVRSLVMPALPETLFLSGLHVARDLIIIVPFSLVMLAAAVAMVRKSKQKPQSSEDQDAREGSPKSHWLSAGVAGFVVGGISGFVGAGGGFMVIPALHLLLEMPMAAAVGTSLMVIAINSSSGALSDLAAGIPADYGLAGLMSLVSLGGMVTGVRLSRKVDSAKLKPAFGYFLIVMALVILIKEVSSL